VERVQDRDDDFRLGDQRYDAEAPAAGTSQSVHIVDALEQRRPVDARVTRDGALGSPRDCGLASTPRAAAPPFSTDVGATRGAPLFESGSLAESSRQARASPFSQAGEFPCARATTWRRQAECGAKTPWKRTSGWRGGGMRAQSRARN
jgi:hypothetical protein